MSLQDQIESHLITKNLPVSPNWLRSFTASAAAASDGLSRNVPLSSLVQTAQYRILNSDIRETLSTTRPSFVLPLDTSDPTVKERRLPGPIPVQVVDIDDIGTSIWSQIEAIERVEKGEAIRGREIVRAVNIDDPEGLENGNGSPGNNNISNKH